MRLTLGILIALGSLGLLGFFGPSSPAPLATSARADSFTVDPVHSNVLFKVMHNRAAYFYGRFGTVSGTFVLDSEDASKCSLAVEVAAESVDTRSERLDQHLRSPDFFDAKQFPVIRFESTEVEAESPGLYLVTGDLTLHGVTKSITIEVEHIGTAEGRGGLVAGFHSTFVVDRTDYGVSYGAGGPLGSDVELIVSIEAGKN